jgi:hypothetical protein
LFPLCSKSPPQAATGRQRRCLFVAASIFLELKTEVLCLGLVRVQSEIFQIDISGEQDQCTFEAPNLELTHITKEPVEERMISDCYWAVRKLNVIGALRAAA